MKETDGKLTRDADRQKALLTSRYRDVVSGISSSFPSFLALFVMRYSGSALSRMWPGYPELCAHTCAPTPILPSCDTAVSHAYPSSRPYCACLTSHSIAFATLQLPEEAGPGSEQKTYEEEKLKAASMKVGSKGKKSVRLCEVRSGAGFADLIFASAALVVRACAGDCSRMLCRLVARHQ